MPECPRRPEGTGVLAAPGAGRCCPALGAGSGLASALQAVGGWLAPGQRLGPGVLGADRQRGRRGRCTSRFCPPSLRPGTHGRSRGPTFRPWEAGVPSGPRHGSSTRTWRAVPPASRSSRRPLSRPPPALRTPPVRGNGHGVLARGAPTGCRLRGHGPFLFVTCGPLAPSPPSSPVPCGRCAAHVAAGPVPADTDRPRGLCHSACFVEQKEGTSVSWATCEGLRCRVPRALCAGRTAWAARPRGSGGRHVTPRGSPPNPLPDAVPREGAELGCRAGHPGNTHQHRPSGSGPAGRGRG